MKILSALAMLIASSFFWPCMARELSPGVANSLPTATEVFHLRSECAALGRKILNDSLIGPGLSQSQVSHYDPKSNRCYIELTIQTTPWDLLTGSGNRIDVYLFDGQTEELLAASHWEGRNDHKSGMVFDRRHETTGNENGFYDDTKLYIETLMDEGQR